MNTWRNTIIPLLWLLLASCLVGGALGTSVARADVPSPQRICKRLDADPHVQGIHRLILDLIIDGHDDDEISDGIIDAVARACPRHVPLLNRYVSVPKREKTA